MAAAAASSGSALGLEAALEALLARRAAGELASTEAFLAEVAALHGLHGGEEEEASPAPPSPERRPPRRGPRLRAERVGCNTVDVSWELVEASAGIVEEEVAGFEVELLRPRNAGQAPPPAGPSRRRPASTPAPARAATGRGGGGGGQPQQQQPPSIASRAAQERADAAEEAAASKEQLRALGLTSLGRSLVPGGGAARRHRFRRLAPMQWYRVRVRAIGLRRSWVSEWSEQLPFKTITVQAAKAAGLHFTASALLAPSERRLQAAVGGGSSRAAAAAAAAGRPEDASSEEEEEEAPLFDCEAVVAGLTRAFGAEGEKVVKDLLDARLASQGWRRFSQFGSRHGCPPETREARMRRTRLAVVAQELYGPGCADGNPWFMGPFFYGGRADDLRNSRARVYGGG